MEAKYSTYEIRVHAVEAVRQGMAVAEVAKAYQVNRSTVHRWVTRYQAKNGNQGLVREPVRGRPRVLGKIHDRSLLSIVLKPASRFGYDTDFWTCPRLCQILGRKFKVKPSRWTVWRWLRDAGLTAKVFRERRRETTSVAPERITQDSARRQEIPCASLFSRRIPSFVDGDIGPDLGATGENFHPESNR